MMDELITFKTAKLAKEKGFDLLCSKYYKATNLLVTDEDFKLKLLDREGSLNPNFRSYAGYYSAPTQYTLQRWLREEHNIYTEALEEGLQQGLKQIEL